MALQPNSLVFIDLSTAGEFYHQLLPLVSEAKQQRLIRFRGEQQRHCSLFADLLARYLACTILGIPYSALRFVYGEHGKPYLPDYPGFQYNLSHTRGAAVAAVGSQPVGVDVERLRPAPLRVANRFFTPGERDYVLSAADAGADYRFFRVWTRKEAFIKRSGMGLATPLRSFDTVTGPDTAGIHTLEVDNFLVSVCSQQWADKQPPAIRRLSAAEFARAALDLL